MAERSLVFDVVANDKASAKLKGIQGVLDDFSKKLAGMLTVSALIDRGFAALQRGFEYITEAAKEAGAIKDAAKAAGLTTEQYQRLSIAAREAGIDASGLMAVMRALRETLKDGAVEGSKQNQMLKALGYSQQEAASGSIDAMDALYRVAGAIEAADGAQQRYNIAAAIFGKRGQEMIPMLLDLRAALDTSGTTAIFSEETIENMDRVEKKIDRINARLKVLAVEGLQAVADKMRESGLFDMMYKGVQAVSTVLPPGIGGLVTVGTNLQNAVLSETPGGKAGAVSQKDKDAANALAKIGSSSASTMGGVTSWQSLGMASSIVLAQQQTAYLATIAANTAPQSGSAIPSGTNFTRPDAIRDDLMKTYHNIRYKEHLVSTPRPAR